MLLSFAACQKIDLDDIKSNKQEKQEQEKQEKQEIPNAAEDTIVETKQHVIIIEKEHSVVYISLKEWHDIPSANSPENGTTAHNIEKSYREGDITGWHIPTREEAKMLKSIYSCNASDAAYPSSLNAINEQLSSLGGDEIHAWEAKSNFPAHRYLCEDATFSFSIKAGSNITAGATTLNTKYHLRLLKDSVISSNE